MAREAAVSDDETLPNVREQVRGEVSQVSADGAYDKRR